MMEEFKRPTSISKVLSSNDTGETGGHQAGILIPKDGQILSFFPTLDRKEKNPREVLHIFDDALFVWDWNFIYYNNKFFGGTRNEYRLTGMTRYLRNNNLKTGDTIILTREQKGPISITYLRNQNDEKDRDLASDKIDETGVKRTKIELGSSWKIIKY